MPHQKNNSRNDSGYFSARIACWTLVASIVVLIVLFGILPMITPKIGH